MFSGSKYIQPSHYYIFYTKGGNTFYERACGTEESAQLRCDKLKTIYDDAFWHLNDIPKDF